MELVSFQNKLTTTNKKKPPKNYYERLNFLHIKKTLMRKFSKNKNTIYKCVLIIYKYDIIISKYYEHL